MAAAQSPLATLRRLCLALPEAHEVEAWGAPTFRVKNRMFAMYAAADTHHGWGRPAVWIKNVPSNQEMLIAARPDRIFKPPYVGPGGWIGVYLDQRVSWKEVEAHLHDAWLTIAPKKLLAALEASPIQSRTPARQGHRTRSPARRSRRS